MADPTPAPADPARLLPSGSLSTATVGVGGLVALIGSVAESSAFRGHPGWIVALVGVIGATAVARALVAAVDSRWRAQVAQK